MTTRIAHRRRHTAKVVNDAVQLTIVFTIVPVIPFTVLEVHLAYGVWGSLATAMLFYGGYPSVFGALMWMHCTRKKEGKEVTNKRSYGLYAPAGRIAPLRDDEKILTQIELREIDAGPEAARKIARRITAQGGFWGPRKD
jgi:hypothetical protein